MVRISNNASARHSAPWRNRLQRLALLEDGWETIEGCDACLYALPSGGSNWLGSRKMSMSSENRCIRPQPLDRLVPPLKITRGLAACSMIRSVP